MDRATLQRITLKGKKRVAWALVILGMALIWPREQWLSDRARAVVKVERGEEDVVWLADDRLLILKTTREAAQGEDRKGAPIDIDWQGSVDLLDVRTHRRKHLPVLTELLNRSGLKRATFRASPDGVWVLWENTYAKAHQRPYVYVANPEGTYSRKWIRGVFDWDREFYWDARHILQIAGDIPGVIVHDPADTAQDREYDKNEAPILFAQYALQHPIAISVPNDALRIAADSIVIDIYDVQANPALYLTDRYTTPPNFKPMQTRKVRLPQEAIVRQAAVSPQQQALFYDLEFTRRQPVLAWLHRFFSKVKTELAVTEELWISGANGQEMHPIGYVPIQANPEVLREEHLQHLQWLPDGKHISFVYRSTLYVISAER